MAKKEMVKVVNRSEGIVLYDVPDLGILRQFQPKEEKEIDKDELRKLDSGTPGGHFILEHLLVIRDEDLVRELLGDTEPEYLYGEDEIRELLENGTLDQLLDALDFAPEGVIGLIKQIAVETELNDMRKRNAIFSKTGFNVTNAININQQSKIDEEEEVKTKERRSTPVSKSAASSGRRAATPAKTKE